MTSELKPLTFADELRAAVRGGLKTHYEELLLQAAELIGAKKSSATPSADTLAGLVRWKHCEYPNQHKMMEHKEGEYVLHSEAAKIIAEKDAEIAVGDAAIKQNALLWKRAEAAEAELSQIKAIVKDANAVHVAMLRGDISKPTLEQINHIYAAPVSDNLKVEALERVKSIIVDYGGDALPDSEYRTACNDLLEAVSALNVEASNDKG